MPKESTTYKCIGTALKDGFIFFQICLKGSVAFRGVNIHLPPLTKHASLCERGPTLSVDIKGSF